MTARQSHKSRRTRGRRMVAGLVLVLISTLLVTMQLEDAAPARADAGAPELGDMTLEPKWVNAQTLTDGLDKNMYKSGVQKLLDNANRQATKGDDCDEDPFGDVPPPPNRYCFENSDATTTEWIPQGVSSVSDAQNDELWGSKKALLVSWYDHKNPGRGDGEDPNQGSDPGCNDGETNDSCNEKGVRVSFLDPETNKYRHVLLVWPYMNSADHFSYDAVHATESSLLTGIHAGGIVWYGNYLYVADTVNGVRIFDMRYIMDLNPDGDADTEDPAQGDGLTSNVKNNMKVGRHDNTFYSYGYRYVMPQIGGWEGASGNASGSGNPCKPNGSLKFSYLSLDRSATDALIAGEYCKADDSDPNNNGRVARYNLDGDTGKLATTCDGDVCVVGADAAYRLSEPNLQGVTAYDGTWYLSRSHLCDNGELFKATVDSGSTGIMNEPYDSEYVAVGPEDLSFWRGSQSVYTVSEHRDAEDDCPGTGGRVLYNVPG